MNPLVRIFWATVLLGSTVPNAVAQDQAPVAVPDVISVIAGQTATLRTLVLLDNDLNPDQTVFDITADPQGHLTLVEGKVLIYQPPDLAVGWDSFSYRLLSPAGDSQSVEVTIRLRAAKAPFAGFWPTPTCLLESCPRSSDWDLGVELGWFHAGTSTVELCDWAGSQLQSCLLLSPPGLPEAAAGGGWEVVATHLDEDGWTDLIFYDPTTGEAWYFRIDEDPAAESVPVLELIDSGTLGAHKDLVFAGQWAGRSPALGIYRPGTSLFLLEGITPNFHFGDPNHPGEPLASDWFGNGVAEIGLWDSQNGILHMRDLATEPWETWERSFRPDGPDGPVTGVAFHVPRGDGHADRFGLFDVAGNALRFYGGNCLVGGCGGLSIQVIEDP